MVMLLIVLIIFDTLANAHHLCREAGCFMRRGLIRCRMRRVTFIAAGVVHACNDAAATGIHRKGDILTFAIPGTVLRAQHQRMWAILQRHRHVELRRARRRRHQRMRDTVQFNAGMGNTGVGLNSKTGCDDSTSMVSTVSCSLLYRLLRSDTGSSVPTSTSCVTVLVLPATSVMVKVS